MKNVLNSAEHAIEKVAEKNRVTVDAVRNELRAAMESGKASASPSVRQQWEELENAGGDLAPELLISFLAQRVLDRYSGISIGF